MKNFNVSFYQRESLRDPGSYYRLYCKVTVDRIRCHMSLNREVEKFRWIATLNKTTGRGDKEKELNRFLETVKEKFYRLERELVERNIPVTAVNLRDAYFSLENVIPKREKQNLLVFFENHNHKVLELVGTGQMARATYVKYQTTFKHLSLFLKEKCFVKDIELDKLKLNHILDFDHWLRVEKKCANNSAIKYIKNTRKVVNEAISLELISSDPFIQYKVKCTKVKPEYLTLEELRRIEQLKLKIERLEDVKNFFLFACYTGLSFCDLHELGYQHIETDNLGKSWIVKERKKTDVISRIPILPGAMRLMKLYKYHPVVVNDKVVFPIISNQKYNFYLREIADAAKITKKLTSHVARHTFATTVTLANGVPLEIVSKLLGHSSIKHTQHYARVLDISVANEMKKLETIFK